MGGIAGTVKLDGTFADREDLVRAQKLLFHRGPNKKGIHLDREIGMAHNRMAVLDISDAANQPISDMAERYWISFDGELYNFLELRKELKASGYRFRSESDTEVALASFVAWGNDCFRQFNGVWAMAIWDSEERALTLSRDPFGFKPLYYFQDDKQVAYSSEIKGFLGFESIELDLDAASVSTAFHYPSVFHATQLTPWKGVKKVLPGHLVKVCAVDGNIDIERWWDPLKGLPSVPSDIQERTNAFNDEFSQACRLRLRADIPMGFCLSGGLTSSAIWEEIQTLAQDPFERMTPDTKAVSLISLPDGNSKELALGEELAKSLKGRQKEFKAHPEDYAKDIQDLIYAFESLDSISVERWLLYRSLTQNDIRLTMEGLGSQMLLGRGVEGICYHAFDQVRELMSAKAALKDPDQWKSLTADKRLPKMTKYSLQSLLSPEDFNHPHSPLLVRDDLADICSPFWTGDREALGDRDLFFQAKYYTMVCGPLQRISSIVEAASMAQGVQVRAPFLDTRLFQYCLALPVESVIAKGKTQVILREAMRGRLPDKIVDNANQSSLTPIHAEWYETRLKELIEDCVSSFSFRSFPVFKGKEVVELVKQKRYAEAWPYVQTFLLNERFIAVKEELFPD